MTPRLLETVLREAAARAADCGGGSLPDGDLVRRFSELRDEAAFNAIVSRHGRVVWAVCRQSLPCEADAEDAFQATFLALSRNAKSVRSHLPAWLHGVAVKVCAQARRSAGRQKVREQKGAVKEVSRPIAESAWDGLLAEVHAEVSRLPATLRAAFVLVDLQGVTQPEAAKQLGWKAGTLTGRLSQARQTLVDRLTARGVAPAAVLAGCGLGTVAANAAVPLKLFTAACAVGKSSAIIPVAVGSLAAAAMEGTLMLKTKLFAAGIMLAAATTITVVSAQTQGPNSGSSAGPTANAGQSRRGGEGAEGGGNTDGGFGGRGGRPGQAGPPGGPPGQPQPSLPGGPGASGMEGGGRGGMMAGMGGGFAPAHKPQPFEYKIIRVNSENTTAQFNELGNEGWELVAIVPPNNGPGGSFIGNAYFKRAKPIGPMPVMGMPGMGAMMGGGGGGMGMGGAPGMGGGAPGMGATTGGGKAGGGGMGMGVPSGAAMGGSPGAGATTAGGPAPGSFPGGAEGGGGGFGFAGGSSGMGAPGNRSPRAQLTSIDTTPLDPKKAATSINELFGDRGVHATEAPDGQGIVISTRGGPGSVDEVKKFIAEYVEKKRNQIQEENKVRQERDQKQAEFYKNSKSKEESPKKP